MPANGKLCRAELPRAGAGQEPGDVGVGLAQPPVIHEPTATAMKGADAVISVLGARGPVIAAATRAIVAVAEQEGPQRIVMMSSYGHRA